MKSLVSAVAKFAALSVAAVALSTAARSADLSEPMILVASTTLDGSPFERTVILATPLPDGVHIGFIVNKPTGVKLAALFPEDAAVRGVEDSAYLGGPALVSVMFAVTRNAPESRDAAIPLMPGRVCGGGEGRHRSHHSRHAERGALFPRHDGVEARCPRRAGWR